MASLRFLWSNRSKFPVNSKRFYKAWGKRLFSIPELFQRNYRRWKLVRQGASVHETAEIGEAIIDGHKHYLTIGSFTFLGRVKVALHCSVSIGNRVCINDGVRILSASHDVLDPTWKHTRAEIVIDDYAWIGMGAIILPGVHLGYGSVVGAGAVVSKSVAAGEIVVGNPARAVKKTRPTQLNYNPCELLAPNQAWLG